MWAEEATRLRALGELVEGWLPFSEEPEKQGCLSLISHVDLDPFLPVCLPLGLPDFLLSTFMAGSFSVLGGGE